LCTPFANQDSLLIKKLHLAERNNALIPAKTDSFQLVLSLSSITAQKPSVCVAAGLTMTWQLPQTLQRVTQRNGTHRSTHKHTRNSSGDEKANVNFLYDDIAHVLQSTVPSPTPNCTTRHSYRKVFRIGTVRYNWPMSAHASQAFSIAHCTDSENLRSYRPCKPEAKHQNITVK